MLHPPDSFPCQRKPGKSTNNLDQRIPSIHPRLLFCNNACSDSGGIPSVEIEISGIPVRGIEVDSHTGCVHYRSTLDIVAIKFKCCQTYYSCSYCHDTESRHPAQIWKRSEFGQKAILCGACGGELTINQYLKCQARCPLCRAAFNPRCELHYHLYFAV
jgi:uncharacterized CHY-type Zn-finger protein